MIQGLHKAWDVKKILFDYSMAVSPIHIRWRMNQCIVLSESCTSQVFPYKL